MKVNELEKDKYSGLKLSNSLIEKEGGSDERNSKPGGIYTGLLFSPLFERLGIRIKAFIKNRILIYQDVDRASYQMLV